MTQTTFEQFTELASRGTFVPVCREIMADLPARLDTVERKPRRETRRQRMARERNTV